MLPKILLCSTCDIFGRWTKEVTYNGKQLKAMKVENERNKRKAKSEFKNGRSEIQDFQYLAVCIVENTVSFGIWQDGNGHSNSGNACKQGWLKS